MSKFASLFVNSSASDQDEDKGKPKVSYSVLLVDDEPAVLSALSRVFRKESYDILTANNAMEALEIINQRRVHLLVSDYMMPGMTGADLLRKVKEQSPDTIRIMLTGQADTTAVMAAINEGAVYRFILKPWNDDDLRVTVALALEQYDLIQKNKELEKTNAKQQKDLQAFSKLAQQNRSQLAIMLHKHNLLNKQQVQEVFKLQQSRKETVIKLLLEKQWIDERKLVQLLKKEMFFEEVSLAEFQIEPVTLSLIPKSLCQKQLIIPLRVSGKRLLLAMADPLNVELIDELGFTTGMQIDPVVATVSAMELKLAELFEEEETSIKELESIVTGIDPFEGIEVVIEDDDDDSLEDLLSQTEQPPAVRLVNAIIIEALRLGASDIHIHPRTNQVIVRYRIDGVLEDKIRIPHSMHMSLVSRIKVMSELDITERRRPQDGRITVKTPMRVVDLRISTLPTLNGEKVVMRVLERNSSVKNLTHLGLSELNSRRMEAAINKPQGMILATGPTGSGKSTSLYALLQHNATTEKNYVTIEDPVEFYLDMAGQVSVREKIGLSFASILRAILRQDPDIILLGEIRDFETAEVALHAALTGHLVFSTLHTNSSIGTIARLLDLGIKPFVAAQALECIIAQRLVRRICDHCREEVTPNEEEIYLLGPLFNDPHLKTYHGRGCHKCNHGYKGRIGLYEVLTITEELRHHIAGGASSKELHEIAVANGLVTLVADAKTRVHNGLTTTYEVLRVLGTQIEV
ncbi:Type II secretory pathway, ATPase PulE/Tfp pilus assembly pathway, ATPase PilB [Hahella chejuensis KCTC 2396]|uniref:Type II secretory pathway, ATPase PulE/Tfp pilus assembly pathway, ATPase PilB n=1 Tax=Hahella chejuensis (strain KCTC 2396) TaxID=349521 RepID=Q2SQC8_HAHCH|nr:ATPase, T2SS/T4P/T4SS family [Hahella chejuensis]ABC27146.1 Type II secretory pathway, ATPase PulE/Tfp pilus assembly pathway, ATPase PilB [Hahella chejuensis KCTC 2396]